MQNTKEAEPKANWTFPEKTLFRFVFVYVLLFINSFSFQHELLPDIGKYTAPFFEVLLKWFGDIVLKIHYPYTIELISDSTGMYIHALLLVFISIILSIIWSVFDRHRKNYHALFYWFMVIVRYYLAIQLLTYGFSKIFKWQFYLPEPNTLFTTLGETPRDLLYWSTMGTSRPYVMFLGLTELVAALLLFFRRTTVIGGLATVIILINVVMINFCFDISVKLYSCFLLLLGIILIAPYAKKLFLFFTGNNFVAIKSFSPNYSTPKAKFIYVASKTVVICFLLADALSIYFTANNFNDDKAPRPLFHGAYEVSLFIRNKDTIAPLLNDSTRWKRIFIHRRGYLITQTMNDAMQDYKLEYDTVNQKLSIKKPGDLVITTLDYLQNANGIQELKGKIVNDSICIRLKKINMDQLPLLQKEFNWTIDE